MNTYRPKKLFITPMKLLTPTIQTVLGVTKKVFPGVEDGLLFYGSFVTYGGTERTSNDLLVVENTAIIETWYRPDIKSDCRIVKVSNNATYEIIGEPENIEERNQYLKFKVRRISGGA